MKWAPFPYPSLGKWDHSCRTWNAWWETSYPTPHHREERTCIYVWPARKELTFQEETASIGTPQWSAPWYWIQRWYKEEGIHVAKMGCGEVNTHFLFTSISLYIRKQGSFLGTYAHSQMSLLPLQLSYYIIKLNGNLKLKAVYPS